MQEWGDRVGAGQRVETWGQMGGGSGEHQTWDLPSTSGNLGEQILNRIARNGKRVAKHRYSIKHKFTGLPNFHEQKIICSELSNMPYKHDIVLSLK